MPPSVSAAICEMSRDRLMAFRAELAAAMALVDDCLGEGAAKAPKAVRAARKTPKLRPNMKKGRKGTSGLGVLPIYQVQACGHTFNSSGCAACLHCIDERANARGWRVKFSQASNGTYERLDAIRKAAALSDTYSDECAMMDAA